MVLWVFEELTKAAVRRQPNETVLFKTEQTGENEYAGNDALVREILQNSLDARTDNKPVRVRLAIHGPAEAPSRARLKHYFERLREPLLSNGFEFDRDGAPRPPCRFFVCEDFGTRGLEGSTELFEDPSDIDASPEDFYWFWRNIGRSAKTGDDLGRWGLGKTVYRAVSRVGCMLGLTIRRSDKRRLLMGQAVLRIHKHGSKEFVPEGFWCGGQDDQSLPLPIEDSAELKRFCEEWRIKRTNEPGLSVVAPFVPDELKADRLLEAVAVHFFSRIVRGELIVEVVGPGIGSVTLDEYGIEDACKRVSWDGPKRTKRHVSPPIDFTKRTMRVTYPASTQLLGQDRLPELTADAFSPEDLTRLRSGFSDGELTSVRVNIWLPQLLEKGEEGLMDVHLEKLSDGTRCDAYYVREGMTITKINARASLRGVRALVNVESGPLAKLLGDTEGPAHEDWDTSAERPDQQWRTWKGRVKFVRGIVDRLVEVLTPPTTEPDFDRLSDFFSIERMGGLQRLKKPGDESKDRTGIQPPVPELKWFHITEREGGFTIARTASVPIPSNPTLKVSLAYDLPRGDPIRNWSPLDFRIGSRAGYLQPTGKGWRAKSLSGNVVMLSEIEEAFRFSVRGFDLHRDLFIRVDDLSNSQEAVE
jgi:hypothetical protein